LFDFGIVSAETLQPMCCRLFASLPHSSLLTQTLYLHTSLMPQVGKETELTARFSTVVHERGSPETMRDVRGFSIKMYTNEGNWDFVGERKLALRSILFAK